jgi:PKD repeat protein
MKSILTILLILITTSVYSQQCGTDIFQNLYNSEEDQKNKKRMNEIIYNHSINKSYSRSGAVLEIPVAVHIVHNNGPENISDAAVITAINNLNLRFENASPFFDSTGHDIQIQFCLASVDPAGNPTNGITRHVSPYTDLFSSPTTGDDGMKNMIRWDPHLYMNIWVVKSISGPMLGSAGYSSLPGSAGRANDGIVVWYTYINNSTLAHEAGHFLGLYHTFNGACRNLNCALEGDFVCDTPPDTTKDNLACSLNSCSSEMDDTSGFNPLTHDVNDLPNYMDYTSCPLSFSDGQSQRMNSALTQIRSTLLLSNGCGQNPGGIIPTASFQYVDTCPFAIFMDTDSNSLGASWDFNSDGVIDNYGKYVYSPFTTYGTYTITMIACGYGGLDTTIQTLTIYGKPTQQYPMINGFNGVGGSVYNPGEMLYCAGATVSLYGEPGFDSYLWSNGATTQDVSFTPTAPFTMSLSATDSTGHVWQSCFPIIATEAPAAIPPVLSFLPYDDAYCMDDLADSIIVHADLSPIRYNVFWTTMGGVSIFVPDSMNYATVISTVSNYYSVSQVDSNGCYASAQININLDYNAQPFGINQSGDTLMGLLPGGYFQWYKDGVVIPGPDSNVFVMEHTGCYTVQGWFGAQPGCGSFSFDTVCIVIASVNDIEDENVLIYPNPVKNILMIELKDLKEENYFLFDVTGLLILEGVINKSTEIDFSRRATGVYFVRVGERVFKVVKT